MWGFASVCSMMRIWYDAILSYIIILAWRLFFEVSSLNDSFYIDPFSVFRTCFDLWKFEIFVCVTCPRSELQEQFIPGSILDEQILRQVFWSSQEACDSYLQGPGYPKRVGFFGYLANTSHLLESHHVPNLGHHGIAQGRQFLASIDWRCNITADDAISWFPLIFLIEDLLFCF